MTFYERICNLIKRGKISLVGSDAATYARAQVEFMGKTKTIEVVFPYGLFGSAPKGASVLLFNVNGQEENIAGIVYDAMSRFKNLKEGEVIVGNPKSGSYVKFAADGKTQVVSIGDISVATMGNVAITSAKAASLTCTNCTVTASGNVAINAVDASINASGTVKLGTGALLGVARMGDAVSVDPSTHIGTITAASAKVKSL